MESGQENWPRSITEDKTMTREQLKALITVHIEDFPKGISMYSDAISKYTYENIIVPMAKRAILNRFIAHCCDSADAYGMRKRAEARTWFSALFYATSYFRKGNEIEFLDSLEARSFHLWKHLVESIKAVDEDYIIGLDLEGELEDMEEAI